MSCGFMVSDDLPRWDGVGRVHEVMLRVFLATTTELDRLAFKFNGTDLPDQLLRKINQTYRMQAPHYRAYGYWYVFALERGCWPVEGENNIEVVLLEKDAGVKGQVELQRVELEIKYLMGKNFHRGFVDGDLGPYEE